MAKKDTGSSPNNTKQSKRLARAKLKAPDQTQGAGEVKDRKVSKQKSAGRSKKPKLTLAEARERRKKRITTIIIVAFAVLMALSMMLPSFSAIFANRNAQEAAEEEQQDTSSSDSDDDSSSDDSSDDSAETDESTVAGIDSEYEQTVQSLEDKLADDPQNLATLLNLGNDYMNWGYQVARIASTDDETTHASDLLTKAEGYYDQYLALNDSAMVRTNRALCQFYAGDTAGATAALEELTQADPDFGPAWANLGLMYEVAGSTDQAKEAYNKAEETDPDDEYGAKSFAETRLASIEASESSTSSTSSSDISSSSSSSATGAEALSDALGDSL